MAIGKNSRKSSSRCSKKFLDKSSGFYGRLDEPETTTEGEEVKGGHGVEDGNTERRVRDKEQAEAFDFNEDDGETLLSRKPNRLSSKWRRSSRRKQKDWNVEGESALEAAAVIIELEVEKLRKMEEENEKAGRGKEPALVHFQVHEDEDDQVLIRDKKRTREEEEEEEGGEEERRMDREQEEGMKTLHGATMRNCRKTLDRALRRGWDTFISNLYSVTLTPVTPSSPPSPSLKKKYQHKAVLAEFR